MSDKVPFDGYEPEGQLDKLLKKTKDNPLVPIGKSFYRRLMSLNQIIYAQSLENSAIFDSVGKMNYIIRCIIHR